MEAAYLSSIFSKDNMQVVLYQKTLRRTSRTVCMQL